MKLSLHSIAPAALVFAASIGSAIGRNDHVSNIRKFMDQTNTRRALVYEESCPFLGDTTNEIPPESDMYEFCVATNEFFFEVMLAGAEAVSEKSTSDKDFMQCFNGDIVPGFVAAFAPGATVPTVCEKGKVLVNSIYTLATEDGSKSIMTDWADQQDEAGLCIDFDNNCDYNDLNGWLKSTIVPFNNFANKYVLMEASPFPYQVTTDHFLMTATCNAKAFGGRSIDNSPCLSYSSDNDCGYPVCTDGCYGSADAFFASYDVGGASMPVDDFKTLVALRYCPDKKKGKSGKKGKKSKSPKA